MCDSIEVLFRIERHMPIEKRKACKFPVGPLNAKDRASGDFQIIEALSPLTGAGYIIEPVGTLIPEQHGDRRKCGVVIGYRVKVNIPACLIGHNRVLENHVPLGVQGALSLLKYALACNGCTQEGLDSFQLEDAIIEDVTPMFLTLLSSEKEARGTLLEVRNHSEAVLNYKPRRGNAAELKPAFSYPRDPVDADSTHTYSSYVKEREFGLLFYAKEQNQPKATLLPIEDDVMETKVNDFRTRGLRMEPKVHAKWLKRNEYHKVSAWENNTEPYQALFNLIRDTLRLDDGLRSTRMKKDTVDTLRLTDTDKAFLTSHLEGKTVRQHPDFRAMPKDQASKRYSALRERVMKRTGGIDLDIPYAVQSRQVSSKLPELLVFRNMFKSDADLAPYVFSTVSGPVAINHVDTITEKVLQSDGKYEPQALKRTPYRGPRLKSGISNAPLDPHRD